MAEDMKYSTKDDIIEELKKNGYKEFKGEGCSIMAHPKSCFFCEHCTDIIYDYSDGPYMFICNNNMDSDYIETGLKGMCKDFKECNYV